MNARPYHLSIAEQEELKAIAPNMAEARNIDYNISHGVVNVIASHGNDDQARVLANWINRHNGAAKIAGEHSIISCTPVKLKQYGKGLDDEKA